MKIVIQRVKEASVSVDGSIVSSIGRGLCVLVGISVDDDVSDAEWVCLKVLNTRFWADEKGVMWKKSLSHIQGEVLFVSQFTLEGKMKGNKPSFHRAMPSSSSKELYDQFLAQVRSQYPEDKVKDGVFGAMMDVSICNDGPVTLIMESPSKNKPLEQESG